MRPIRTLALVGVVVTAAGALAAATSAHSSAQPMRSPDPQQMHSPAHPPTPGPAPAGVPVRITMEELHRHGGVPPGWRFTLPTGDAKAGREVFARLECHKCHAVQGDFPPPPQEPGNAGPELSGMGGHHSPEYMAQSVLDPNAVIVTGPGYTGADGLSIMPSFTDSLTVPELIDLVAYLGSLAGGGPAHDHHAGAPAPEQVAGDYRIRVAYHGRDGAAAGGHGHGDAPGTHRHAGTSAAPGHAAPAATPARDHLMVFVTDARTGEPVPYLPVTVTIHAARAQPRSVKLAPMLGAEGFHYGADLTLPAGTTKLTVAIGPITMKVMPSAAGRFAGAARATFEWPR